MANLLTASIRRGDSLSRVRPLDDYQSLTFTEKLNGRGDWKLEAHRDSASAKALLGVPDPGIVLHWPDHPTIASGAALAYRRTSADRVTFVGIDDSALLGDRIVEPDPTLTGGAAHDVRTGKVSTILREFIDANAGPGAHPSRRIPGLVLAADPLVGDSITVRGRYQYLDELIADHADYAGLRVRVTHEGDELVARLSPTRTRPNIVFAPEWRNLADFTLAESAATATVAVVAGSGELAFRLVERIEAAPSGRFSGRRVERFIDQRNEADAAALRLKGSETLEKEKGKQSLSVDLAEFDPDLGLGDVVRVIIDETAVDVPIVETRTEVTPDDVRRKLIVGAPLLDSAAQAVASSTARVATRITNIERA